MKRSPLRIQKEIPKRWDFQSPLSTITGAQKIYLHDSYLLQEMMEISKRSPRIQCSCVQAWKSGTKLLQRGLRFQPSPYKRPETSLNNIPFLNKLFSDYNNGIVFNFQNLVSTAGCHLKFHFQQVWSILVTATCGVANSSINQPSNFQNMADL